MRNPASFVLALLLSGPAGGQDLPSSEIPTRPVATYSIVARDAETGQLGVAVQSHWFSVGSIVTWAEAGVGAVATQSFAEPSYGPLGLELMRTGRTATEALSALAGTDEGRAVRQVAMVDADGDVSAYTGQNCIAAAGHQVGEGYSVQANLMDRDTVWPAMAAAYEASDGDLAERLLAALEAAQVEGGDIRGKQSAALLIVEGERADAPWKGRVFDLRVEDHPEPLAELRRLVTLQRAYLALNHGDELMAAGDVGGAMASYREATTLVPDEATNGEAAFWTGVTLASIGREDDALPWLARSAAQDDRWARLVPRLPASGLLPDDEEVIARLVTAMEPATER
jgi:uncharacterized Ntn-hydrolase superfamily protein